MPLDGDIYQRIIAAKLYMDDNYHVSINLEAVSQRACFSPFHFHRLFTRIYRKTPHQYITTARMNAAKALLQEEGTSIMEVCNAVGFESAASFSLLFKKQNGDTPQLYRKKASAKNQQLKEQPKSFIPHCFIETYGLDK